MIAMESDMALDLTTGEAAYAANIAALRGKKKAAILKSRAKRGKR